jgi:tetratricopeptide (TPR) repeat protein
MGDLSAALADYDQAIRLKPELVDAHYNRGLLHEKQNRPLNAIADLERYLTLGGGLIRGDRLEVEERIQRLTRRPAR